MNKIKSKKILITGFSGMLGKDIVEALRSQVNYEIYGIDRRVVSDSNINAIVGDITDFVFMDSILKEISPDIIIHCAAIVDVDACEKNKDAADKLHVEASRKLASHKSKFVYISTDSVFDGKVGNYKEDSKPNPLNYYAKSKLEGERASIEENPNAIVIRTNIYGFRLPSGRSLAEWAIGEFESGRQIHGFDDIYFNPLYTRQLAMIVNHLIKIDFSGMINAVSLDKISKYQFLVELAKSLGYSEKLIARDSIQVSNLTAKRPTNSTLNPDKIKSLYDSDLLTLKTGLSQFKHDFIRVKGEQNEN